MCVRGNQIYTLCFAKTRKSGQCYYAPDQYRSHIPFQCSFWGELTMLRCHGICDLDLQPFCSPSLFQYAHDFASYPILAFLIPSPKPQSHHIMHSITPQLRKVPDSVKYLRAYHWNDNDWLKVIESSESPYSPYSSHVSCTDITVTFYDYDQRLSDTIVSFFSLFFSWSPQCYISCYSMRWHRAIAVIICAVGRSEHGRSRTCHLQTTPRRCAVSRVYRRRIVQQLSDPDSRTERRFLFKLQDKIFPWAPAGQLCCWPEMYAFRVLSPTHHAARKLFETL